MVSQVMSLNDVQRRADRKTTASGTHLGLALNTLFAAQGRLVALLLLSWRRVLALLPAGRGIRAGRGLRRIVIHGAGRHGRLTPAGVAYARFGGGCQ